MIDYTKQILEDIMYDATLGRSIAEIAIRLGISHNRFLDDFNSPTTQIKRYYDSGVAEGQTKTDKRVYTLALNGSSSAKQLYDNKLLEAKLSNSFDKILSIASHKNKSNHNI